MEIIGTVQHQSLGTGFWGIVDDGNNKWRPLEMPEKLQVKDLRVKVKAKKSENQVSIFMWGTMIDILNYEIISE